MKKILSLVIIVVLLGVAYWWFARQTDEPANPVKIVQPSPTPRPASVVASPVLSSKPPAASSAVQPQRDETTQANSADVSRAELKATVSHFIELLEADDYNGFFLRNLSPQAVKKEYQAKAEIINEMNRDLVQQGQSPMPALKPLSEFEKSERESIQTGRITPTSSDLSWLQTLLAALKSIENTTPTLNDAGDVAEYTLDPAISATLPHNPGKLIFHKENGQWYEGTKP